MAKKLILPEDDIVIKYQEGESCTALAKSYGCGAATIHRIIIRSGIKRRQAKDYNTCKILTKLSNAHKEILNGLILSDATCQIVGKGLTPRIEIATIHEEFANHIISTLPLRCNITETPGYSKIVNGIQWNAKLQYRVISRVDLCLHEFRRLWYTNNKKTVPRNLSLSPLLLKYWFLGDGHSSYIAGSRGYVQVGFSTNGFTLDDCKYLVKKLQKDCNLYGSISKDRGHHKIKICRNDDVNRFFDYIGEPKLQCFNYKWKRPKQ
jgi:hypothetical protein